MKRSVLVSAAVACIAASVGFGLGHRAATPTGVALAQESGAAKDCLFQYAEALIFETDYKAQYTEYLTQQNDVLTDLADGGWQVIDMAVYDSAFPGFPSVAYLAC